MRERNLLAINCSQFPLLPQDSLQTFSSVNSNIHDSHVFLFPNLSLSSKLALTEASFAEREAPELTVSQKIIKFQFVVN